MFDKINVPVDGEKIVVDENGKLTVPNNPILPFIEGDGIGEDITKAAMVVWDAAVKAAYGGEKKVSWMEIYSGEKAVKVYGDDVWLPDETIEAVKE